MELDNPAWHALRGSPRHGSGRGSAGLPVPGRCRGVRGASPTSRRPRRGTRLRALIGDGEVAILVRDALATPEGWEQSFSLPAVQMVATAVDGQLDPEVERLGVETSPRCSALVKRTKPGPFGSRTIELGEYFGIRDESGALVAMAGERIFPAPYREISAVCTDEAYRGKGLAARLVRHLVARIEGRGETPMLHAAGDNTNAIRLYETLGFTHSRTLQ